MKVGFVFLFLVYTLLVQAQEIDVQHYQFELQLGDESDRITGKAAIQIRFLQPASEVSLDLVGVNAAGKGMKVDSVAGEMVSGFQQVNNKIRIQLKQKASVYSIQSFRIVYSGTPADGLIISKNKYGDRTFFADNWPNRARHWIPCNDTPDDKATVEFIVTAPSFYQIISNGIQIEETNLDKNRKLTYWKEGIPIPTKVMVIGAAQFAVALIDSNHIVPVTAWVYPQNKNKGFYDYALTASILQFFSQYIGPYPFEKLANVQSKTIFGGMENASVIFYAENSVTGDRKSEDLMSHEIAHQWFGDMVTEKSYAHLWLSEGFASYMTDMYWEQKYGKEAFQKRLQYEREKVISFSKVNTMPVVDSVSDWMELLNPNSYQKGAWVLHMLRKEVSDSVFQTIIQTYYQQYKGSNADSRDFQKVAETISGRNLNQFFNQWLYQSGIPKIKAEWKITGDKVHLIIQQRGNTIFQFPLEVAFILSNGEQLIHHLTINSTTLTVDLPAIKNMEKVILDPNFNLLFDGEISKTQ